MRLPLRFPWVWLGLGWLLIMLAVTASLIPGDKLPVPHWSDKFKHSLVYAVLTLWFAGMYSRASYWKVGASMLVLGIAIEIAQGAMPFGREPDVRDVGANALGIVVALALALAGLGVWAQTLEAWALRLAGRGDK